MMITTEQQQRPTGGINMAWKDYINRLKAEWIGQEVVFQGSNYQVVDIDYNGSLLINRPQYYVDSYTAKTTAVETWQIKRRFS